MRGYRVKHYRMSFKVQVRFLLFWRTLAVYPYYAPVYKEIAKKEAMAVTTELMKRSSYVKI